MRLTSFDEFLFEIVELGIVLVIRLLLLLFVLLFAAAAATAAIACCCWTISLGSKSI